MKILVISDTHGDVRAAANILRNEKDTDIIIHLGDYFRDAQKLSEMFPDVRFEFVYGNSDIMIGVTPAEKLLKYENKTIFITHGHRYSVKWGVEKLRKKAAEEEIDLILFGHTHEAYLERTKGYILLNPGSTSFPRGNSGMSYAKVEICDEGIKPSIVNI